MLTLYQAGLAAYFLGLPDTKESPNPFTGKVQGEGTIGERMKRHISHLSFQRVKHDKKAKAKSAIKGLASYKGGTEAEFMKGYPIPNWVGVAYNNAHGDQRSKKVDGFVDNPPS